MKICPLVAELRQVDKWMDGYTDMPKLVGAFCYVNAPKMAVEVCVVQF